jgi:hypothetical protein
LNLWERGGPQHMSPPPLILIGTADKKILNEYRWEES